MYNFNRILEGRLNLVRKPWGMRDDGDVWGIVHELVQQRGAHTSKCTKVKGHATAQMVADGRVRPQDQRGNDGADAAVGRGYATYGQHRRALAGLFEERARRYAVLVVGIQRVMLDILAATRSRRAEMLRGLLHGTRGARRLCKVNRPFLPDLRDGRVIRQTRGAIRGASEAVSAGWVAAIPTYLESLRWVERCEGAPHAGVSWLELLVDFELSTGHIVRPAQHLVLDHARLLRRQTSVKDLVKLFQREVLSVTVATYPKDVEAMFRAAKGGRARLSGLCTNTSAACFRAWPCWDVERHVATLAAILLHRGVEHGRATKGLMEEDLLLPLGRLQLDTPARWGQRLDMPAPASTHAEDGGVASHYPISCSKCRQTHVLAEKPAIHGASARIRCQQCHVQVRVSKCTCVTCGNFVAKCRCGVQGPIAKAKQRSLRDMLGGGGGSASSSQMAGEPGQAGSGRVGSAQGLTRRHAPTPLMS